MPKTVTKPISRRRFLRGSIALAGTGLATGLYSFKVEPRWVETVELPLPLRKLPPPLEGKTLVQISDMHIGNQFNWQYQLDTFADIAATKPDFVVYTGDFVSYESAERVDQLAEVLQHAPKGTLATVGILGNHDFGRGWRDASVANAITTTITDSGINVLRNRTDTFAGLQILGVDDFWSPTYDPSFLSTVDFGQPTLALCHNPDLVDLPIWRDFNGMFLSGHTHGGQVRPPFLPPPFIPVDNKRYTAGLFELTNNRTLYINRGLGSILSLRFNARPEVTLFTLKSI